MPNHFLHRFAFEAASRRHWVTLQQEQMDAVLGGERRVVEGVPSRSGHGIEHAWWYFNDTGPGQLRVETGPDAERTIAAWQGLIHDAYAGRLCAVRLP